MIKYRRRKIKDFLEVAGFNKKSKANVCGMREIRREIVSAMIFSKDGKLFLGMKDQNGGGVYADCWHLPGGGVDDGESMEQALIREIREETGIDIREYEFELIDNSGEGESEKILKDTGEKVLCKMKFNVYKIIIDDKYADDIEIVLDDDLKAFAWKNIEELNECKLTPPAKKLFLRLGYINLK